MLDSFVFTCPSCQVWKRWALVSFPSVRTAGGQPRTRQGHENKWEGVPEGRFVLVEC